MVKPSRTYASSGVDYSSVDPIKVLAQTRAKDTAVNLTSFGAQELAASRGESAYVWQEKDTYRAFVIEGLGTKNLIADSCRSFTGKSHYDAIAQDTIAMIVNDLIVVGAMPTVINAYFAVGDGAWLADRERAEDLINGWADSCQSIGATWGGGETPVLKDIIAANTIDIAGAAIGVISSPKDLVLGDKLQAGDDIVLIESSGIHANGISFVRSLAKDNKDIYSTKLPSGITFGEALLRPTHLYVNLVRELQKKEVDIHYMVNITGHGWRKLMRTTKDFSYVIDQVPEVPEEFRYIQEVSGTDDKEMYGTFNMGAGFAIYVTPSESEAVLKTAEGLGLKAIVAGTVRQGTKEVVIKPNGVSFSGDSLELR